MLSQGVPELPAVIAPTPAVAELGKYGTYPVSMNTGIPNISFPLFDVSVAEISLPFSLSYHAGGIKVNQEATEVGLGWSISGNMVIHRNVLGTPDEATQGNFNMAVMDINDYYDKCSHASSEREEDYYELKATADGAGEDSRPDMFNYNIAGKSGQFIYASDRSYMTFPYEPIKIERDVSGSNYYFAITDEKGTKYRFRDINKILIDDNPSPKTYHITDWYLTDVISRNKQDTIHFEYETCGYVKEQKEYYQIMGRALEFSGSTLVPVQTSPLEDISYSNIAQEEMRIKRITYRNGEVVFNYNTQRLDRPQTSAKMLDDIKIYDSNGIQVKEFHFSYNYFTANFTGSSGYPDIDKKRLKLLGFSEVSIAQPNLKKEHTFDYETAISIPRKGSFAQDYWGYFNGKANNSLIPSVTVQGSDFYLSNLFEKAAYYPNPNVTDQNTTWSIGSANRAVDTSKMRMCMLKKITYPTKGYTKFEFEPHAYTSELGGSPTTVYGGGLRIANIKNYLYDGTLASFEEYRYGINENGLGEKLFDEELFFKNYDDYTLESWEGPLSGSNRACANWVAAWQRKYLGIDVYASVNYNGGSLVYKEVNHYQGTNPSSLLKTKYEYNLVSETTLTGIYQPENYFNSSNYGSLCHSWTDSQLLTKTTYKKNGASYTPVHLEENTYSTIFSKNDYGLLVKERQRYIEPTTYSPPLCESYGPGTAGDPLFIIAGQFFYKSRAYRMTQKKETSYLPSTSDAVVVTSTMGYGNTTHMQMTTSTTTSSDGKTTINKMFYPNDITSTNTLLGPTLSSPQKLAVDRLKTTGDLHRLITPVQTEVYSDDNSNGTAETGELVALQRTDYKDWGGALVLPEAIGTLKGAYNSSTNTLQDRIAYHSYDSFGNPIEVSKADGSHIYYVWGYNKQYPIAKIENFDASIDMTPTIQNLIASAQGASNADDDTCLDGESCDEANLRGVLGTLRNALPEKSLVSTYTYDPLIGITSMTDPRGYTTYYLYDGFNRLEYVKDNQGKVLSENEYHYKGQ
ncbi:hypothetical protein GCM10022395_01710 [Snuella lapsa]|uniref:YD repeat-containing protein n=2 Tax=Snuella lapsa TaxID=870481 RepID=A0ABP6WML7_9FLAO